MGFFEKQGKIDAWCEKCNFLHRDGNCGLTIGFASGDKCSFEDCIFMKKQKQKKRKSKVRRR